MTTSAETLRQIIETLETLHADALAGASQLNEYATWKTIEDQLHKAIQVGENTSRQHPNDPAALRAALNSVVAALNNAYSYISQSPEMSQVRSGQAAKK